MCMSGVFLSAKVIVLCEADTGILTLVICELVLHRMWLQICVPPKVVSASVGMLINTYTLYS